MVTRSFDETYDFGFRFAKNLRGGEVIGLIGELGSGKTTFVKGLAEGLKVAETITSPTFVILKVYKGRIENRKIELVHVDAYRVENIEDIKSVGIEDYFSRSEIKGSARAGSYFGRDDVILVIEWAEKVKEILPKSTIYINFKHISEKERKIMIKK